MTDADAAFKVVYYCQPVRPCAFPCRNLYSFSTMVALAKTYAKVTTLDSIHQDHMPDFLRFRIERELWVNFKLQLSLPLVSDMN